MKHPTPTYGLSRQSAGLSPAHKALIALLAAAAVENFLRETEPADQKEAHSE